MSKFKVGDKVWCKEDNLSKGLIKCQRWTVSSISGDWMSLEGNGHAHHVNNFSKEPIMMTTINEKAKPKTKTNTKPSAEAFYVRHKPSNHGISMVASQSSSVQVPATMIATYEDAVNEANRLAELHAGSEFVILGVVYKVKKVPVYTTQAQEYSV